MFSHFFAFFSPYHNYIIWISASQTLKHTEII